MSMPPLSKAFFNQPIPSPYSEFVNESNPLTWIICLIQLSPATNTFIYIYPFHNSLFYLDKKRNDFGHIHSDYSVLTDRRESVLIFIPLSVCKNASSKTKHLQLRRYYNKV